MLKKISSTLNGWRSGTGSRSASAQTVTNVTAAEKALRLKKLSSDTANVDIEASIKKAEASRAQSEANAAAQRAVLAKAEARLKWAVLRKREAKAKLKWLALPVAVGAALAADWWYHDYVPGIKWRMKRTLRDCPVPVTGDLKPSDVLPIPQQPPALDLFKPLMLLGPSGSGKSTVLAKFARESATATPTVLVRLRLPLDNRIADSARDPSAVVDQPASAHTLRRLQAMTADVYRQMGFPQRHSLVYLAGDWLRSLESGPLVQVQAGSTVLEVQREAVSTMRRLKQALSVLYGVCEALQQDRVQVNKMSKLDASCVIIIDDVQELLNNEELAAAGGRTVFGDIGTLAVAYGLDRTAVRTVVAGNSGFVASEFARLSVANRARWEFHELADPDHNTVYRQLLARGYTDAEAELILSVCGCRLGLLAVPLQRSSKVHVHQWRRGMEHSASASLSDVITSLPLQEQSRFAGLLNAVAAASESGLRVPVERMMGSAPFSEQSGALMSQVLYLDAGSDLHFQSELLPRVWPTISNDFQGGGAPEGMRQLELRKAVQPVSVDPTRLAGSQARCKKAAG